MFFSRTILFGFDIYYGIPQWLYTLSNSAEKIGYINLCGLTRQEVFSYVQCICLYFHAISTTLFNYSYLFYAANNLGYYWPLSY